MRLAIYFVILISTAYCADFTTYVGGASQSSSQFSVAPLATDSEGDTYVTGSNASITKLDASGSIVFTTTLGSSAPFSYSNSYGFSIAVDPSGTIWMAGQTTAANFPLKNALQSSVVPNGTGFLAKMAPNGTLLYSSYFGGALGNSAVNGVATDQDGNVYITGWTDASDFPVTPGLPASPVNPNAPAYGIFVAKLNSAGQKILYSTVITGSTDCGPGCFANTPKTVGNGIAVDGSGNALVAGTSNTALPAITGGASGSGAFVFKINAAGNGAVYFMFVGAKGNASFGARPIAADASGNAYITGYTNSTDFPASPGAYQTTFDAGNNSEAFAMKLDPSGAIVWATFLGGQSNSNTSPGAAIALDNSDNVWLTGTNDASTPDPSFVAELSADGSALPYLAQFPAAEAGEDIAVDTSGVVHVAGPIGLVSTITPTEPLAPRLLSIVNAASGQFSGTVTTGEIITLYGPGLGPTTPVSASPQNGRFPTSLGGVQVLVGGTPIPLLYVSSAQINAEIPSPLDDGPENGMADVRVVNNSVALPDFRAGVAASDFSPFYSSGAYLAVTNQDGTVNSKTNPAKAGSYVSLWGTGLGSVPGVVMDGAVATVANNYCSSCQVSFRTFGVDVIEPVLYAGSAPGLIDGLMQINVMIPPQMQAQPTPQLQVSLYLPGATIPMFLGFVWISQTSPSLR
jgi:uncharacterized protein (TIGR03437 family)